MKMFSTVCICHHFCSKWNKPLQVWKLRNQKPNKFALSLVTQLAHQFTDSVQDRVDDLFADGVVPTGIIIGCVLLSWDQLFGVEELTVGPSAHLVYRERCKKTNKWNQKRLTVLTFFKKNCDIVFGKKVSKWKVENLCCLSLKRKEENWKILEPLFHKEKKALKSTDS